MNHLASCHISQNYVFHCLFGMLFVKLFDEKAHCCVAYSFVCRMSSSTPDRINLQYAVLCFVLWHNLKNDPERLNTLPPKKTRANRKTLQKDTKHKERWIKDNERRKNTTKVINWFLYDTFLLSLSIKTTLYNLPHSHKHFLLLLSAFYLTFRHIYT